MISKELFCTVMNVSLNRLVEFEYKTNMVSGTGYYYFIDNEHLDDEYEFINIHELAHKCKEWAHKYWYQIDSCYDGNTSFAEVINIKKFDPEYPQQFEIEMEQDTEPEAIFKACEWILEQKAKS